MSIQDLTHGLDAWTSELQRICGHFQTQMAFNQSLFIGEIALRYQGGMEVAHLRTNAGLISRDTIQPDHDDDQGCFLISQRSGFSQVTQNGVALQLAPGDLLLMDSIGSCEIMPFGLIEHTSLSLPRADVERVLKNNTFGKVSNTCSSGKMLHLLMDQLCRQPERTDGDGEGDALRNAFISLLAPSLCAQDQAPEPGAVLDSQSLRSYVNKVIDESLTQPTLNPVGLASRLNISVRHLYRLFEDRNDSVCRYIQRSRLRRSADDLSNPFMRSESITSIAYKWGFTDSAHFSRAFKKQFERSPKEYRAMALMETAGAA